MPQSPLMKPFVVLALPGMYLFYKYNQYKRRRKENAKRRLTERELQHLNNKIVSMDQKPNGITCKARATEIYRIPALRDLLLQLPIQHRRIYLFGRTLGRLVFILLPAWGPSFTQQTWRAVQNQRNVDPLRGRFP